MKYHIITFGCQMNKSDSERVATILEKEGYNQTSNIEEADLIVVNMCSIRQSAVDRVFGLSQNFSKLKSQNPNLKTILTGCILKEDKRKFAKGFDQVLKIKDLLRYQPKYQNNFSAFVPISNGCDNFCTYCVVPFVRGLLVCRNHKEILREVKKAVKNRFREVWLLGQNVNNYASKDVNFAKLLKMVNEIEGNFWIRFTSPHPKDFSDELIETMAKCEKVTPYLNLPVQSGDNEILKRMNRPYTVLQYKNLVKKIRMAFKKYRRALEKEMAISTDIIVGFPGETKKQFESTVKLFKEIKLDMAYIAKYSPRPQTVAFKLRDDVSSQEKEKRYKILTDLLKKIAFKKNKKYIGKEAEVLVEEIKNGFLIGKTRTYKTVKFESNKDLIGQFVKVKILNATPFGLRGELMWTN